MSTSSAVAQVESGNPLEDPRAFRRCLGQFPTGVTIMTTRHAGRPVGVTANSFASVSIDPPLVLWSIAHSSRSHAAFAEATAFNINILTTDQVPLSQHFAGREEDKFASVAWEAGALGEPVLPEVLACLECTVETTYRGGDHTILIGRVQRYVRNAGQPLLYAQGRYAVAEDHPQIAAAASPSTPLTGAGATGSTMRFTTALSLVGTQLSGAFEQLRTGEGLDLAQGRVLSTLRGGEALGVEQVAERAYVARQAAEDALASLLERGCVLRREQGYGLTDTGRALLETMKQRFGHLEDSLLEGLSARNLSAARDVLHALLDRLRPAR